MKNNIFDTDTINKIVEKIKKDKTGVLAKLMQEIMEISEKAGQNGFTIKELSIIATTGWYLSQTPELRQFFDQLISMPPPSDDDVWNSLRISGHLSGKPNSALQNRLERMRNWIGSIHFPEDARINIQKVIDENSRAQLSSEQLSFLEKLAVELGDSEWSDEAIGNTIRMTSANSGVSGREAYIALYWAMLGRSHGPKASALIFEIGKSAAIELFGS